MAARILSQHVPLSRRQEPSPDEPRLSAATESGTVFRWDDLLPLLNLQPYRNFDWGKQKAVFHRGGRTCAYCGVALPKNRKRWNVDHFIPKSKGGSNEQANLKLSCHRCNSLKTDLMPDEFYALLSAMCLRVREMMLAETEMAGVA